VVDQQEEEGRLVSRVQIQKVGTLDPDSSPVTGPGARGKNQKDAIAEIRTRPCEPPRLSGHTPSPRRVFGGAEENREKSHKGPPSTKRGSLEKKRHPHLYKKLIRARRKED